MSARTTSTFAFTLVELLVALAIIALLIAILLPTIGKARESSRRSTCSANLNSITKSMILYAASENERYPCQPPPDVGMTGYWVYPPVSSGAGGDEEFAIEESFTNYGDDTAPFYIAVGDPFANMWLLVLKRQALPKQFICPSDSTSPSPADISFSPPLYAFKGTHNNFGTLGTKRGRNTFSYSFAYPWYADGKPPADFWKNTMDATLPIGSDMAPSGISALNDPTAAPKSAKSNSKNHSGTGQNIAFADGHVEFSASNRAGQQDDNIFSAKNDTIYVDLGGSNFNNTLDTTPPNAPFDIIMVPARP